MMNRFLQDIRLGGQQVITPVEGGEKLNEKTGENLFVFYDRPSNEQKIDVSAVYGAGVENGIPLVGKGGQILDAGKDNATIMHETMHFIGFSDRYGEYGKPNEGYKNTIMATAGATKMHVNHYKHVISYVLRQHQLLTPKYPNLKYIWSNQKMDAKGVDEQGQPDLKD